MKRRTISSPSARQQICAARAPRRGEHAAQRRGVRFAPISLDDARVARSELRAREPRQRARNSPRSSGATSPGRRAPGRSNSASLMSSLQRQGSDRSALKPARERRLAARGTPEDDRQIRISHHSRADMLKPTTTASNRVHRGRVIDVSTERLRYANGREYEIDFVRHPGAAAVVAIDDAGRVCLVRQYRHGIADFMWEIPAGKLDSGEAPEVCAVRELAEETGVTARRWTSLGLYVPAPGIFTRSDSHVSGARPRGGRGRAGCRRGIGAASGCRSAMRSAACCAANGMTEKRPWRLLRAQYQLQL